MPEHAVRDHVPWWTWAMVAFFFLCMLALGGALLKGLQEGHDIGRSDAPPALPR